MCEIELTDIDSLAVEGESSHRLENVVISAYKEKIDGGEENPRHNEGSLFLFFADTARFYDEEHRNAYRMVIQDVLDHMERNATLYRDDQGWYYLHPEAIRFLTQS